MIPGQPHPAVEKAVVAAFDFDGTITDRDTFLPFLFYTFGKRQVIAALLSALWTCRKCKCVSDLRDSAKASVIKTLFSSKPTASLIDTGNRYAQGLPEQFRENALHRIEWHRRQGHRLIMVSASIDLYLTPVAHHLGFDDLLCTRLSITNEHFDGGIRGLNCRGAEKVRRLQECVGTLPEIDLYAYGDSDGDAALLAVADHPYYRRFSEI